MDSVLPLVGLYDDLDFVLLSGEVGVEKPDTRIYRLAMQEAGVTDPGSFLHIGDSLEKDYLPAKALGIQAILLDRFNTKEAEEWRAKGYPVSKDFETIKEELVTAGMV